MHDENLRLWLEGYIEKHPHHSTAILSRDSFIGIAQQALDAYLDRRYFLPESEGGKGADPATSSIEELIRGYRQRIEGVDKDGYLGTFIETETWIYLSSACDIAINENALVVCYGKPGIGKTRSLMEYVVQKMTTVPVQILCSRNTTPYSFVNQLAEECGVEVTRGNVNLVEVAIAKKLVRWPRPIFIDQANYLNERSLGTLCFLWEKRHIPIVLVGTKQLYDSFSKSKLTEEVRSQLTSRIALHYLLPELTQEETSSILFHAFGTDATDEMIKQIHEVTGGLFRGVDMIIPRIRDITRRNKENLESGRLTMNEIISIAAARLMI